jgi:adenylate kinase
MKYMGQLVGLKKDVINQVIPETIDELKAEEENILLRQNSRVDVQVEDDHFMHIAVHNKMEDTAAKVAHINAHKRALILKQTRPELFPADQPQMTPEGMPEGGMPAPSRETSSAPVQRLPNL